MEKKQVNEQLGITCLGKEHSEIWCRHICLK